MKNIWAVAISIAILLLASCGSSEKGRDTSTSPNSNGLPSNNGPTILHTRIYDAPMDDSGLLQLTASEQPATFSVEWELKKPSGTNYSNYFYINLILSRNSHVDPSDLKVASISCYDITYDDDYETTSYKNCNYRESYLCSYHIDDTIQCLDNSRDDARYIHRYLGETGDWPWNGYLIMEFCYRLKTDCAYSSAFPVQLKKQTNNSNIGSISQRAILLPAGQIQGYYGPKQIDDIQVTGAFNPNGRMVLESDTRNNMLTVERINGSSSYDIAYFLSSDDHLSANDIEIFSDYITGSERNNTACIFTPLNEIFCGNFYKRHLAEYFSNNGDLPWEGYLLIQVGDYNDGTFIRSIPIRLQH